MSLFLSLGLIKAEASTDAIDVPIISGLMFTSQLVRPIFKSTPKGVLCTFSQLMNVSALMQRARSRHCCSCFVH